MTAPPQPLVMNPDAKREMKVKILAVLKDSSMDSKIYLDALTALKIIR
jgi:hypothetical protein